ncbi:MAG: glycosyltransferase [Acidobacteria bacterium]|nr:MAG: glycosyltransferase [Acidobacteriota bacterium]
MSGDDEDRGASGPRDAARERYAAARIEHWDAVARTLDSRRGLGGGYHRRLAEVYRSLIPEGRRVIEIGCGEGDLLAALAPSFGVGIDFSGEMVRRAAARHPGLHFLQGDAHDLSDLEGTFDAVVLSDLFNDVWDVQGVLEQLRRFAAPHTRIAVNSYSHLWEGPLAAAARLGLSKPNLPQNWLTKEDVANLLRLAGFEVVRAWTEVLWPLATPALAGLCNRVLVRLWPLRHLALANFFVARVLPDRPVDRRAEPVVSVVVPARNEAGNIPEILAGVPEMGAGTEIVFVEGNSSDETWDAVEREIAAHPERRCVLLRQTGDGKGDAVRLGFAAASGDVLMILDADLTVPPEELPRFYRALVEGKGEFINGVRLVYPMERQAMRLANLLGNKFFSMAFSWLLGQPIKDTLCGTKVLWTRDYETIAANRAYFGEFDPFGDFDLLFGAARLGLKIAELPVRYRERTYGTTNIRRWRHGVLLLRMVIVAAGRVKFV